MNGKPCASSDWAQNQESIDWNKGGAYVKKLQMRIVKAQKGGHYSKVIAAMAVDPLVLCESLGCKASDQKQRQTDIRRRP